AKPTVPASSTRSQNFTWFVILESAWGCQDQLHDLLDIFLHALKFPARQVELSLGSGNLGVRSDGGYVFHIDMNQISARFRQSDPSPRFAGDTITTERDTLYDGEL